MNPGTQMSSTVFDVHGHRQFPENSHMPIDEDTKRAYEERNAIPSVENDENSWDGMSQPILTHLGELLTIVCKSKHLIRYRFTKETMYTDELDSQRYFLSFFRLCATRRAPDIT